MPHCRELLIAGKKSCNVVDRPFHSVTFYVQTEKILGVFGFSVSTTVRLPAD